MYSLLLMAALTGGSEVPDAWFWRQGGWPSGGYYSAPRYNYSYYPPQTYNYGYGVSYAPMGYSPAPWGGYPLGYAGWGGYSPGFVTYSTATVGGTGTAYAGRGSTIYLTAVPFGGCYGSRYSAGFGSGQPGGPPARRDGEPGDEAAAPRQRGDGTVLVSIPPRVEEPLRLTVGKCVAHTPEFARLTVGDQTVTVTGGKCEFATPELGQGGQRSFTVTVKFEKDGKWHTVSKEVAFTAGKTTEVQFGPDDLVQK